MKQDRRQFTMTMMASMLPLACANSFAWSMALEQKRTQLPISFSTLGCPKWDWNKILDFAAQHGFAAIELRGLEGNMDLPSHPVFAPGRIAQTRKEIRDHGLKIACVSSSANLYFEDPSRRTKEVNDARRFIDLAASLEAANIRVFGGKAEGDKSPAPDAATKTRVASGLHELGEYAEPHGVTVLIESHDHLTASSTLKDVLRQADSNHVGLLWDAHHTYATSNEDPEFTVKELGQWIRHTHLKDSVGSGENRKYVLTGRGNVPIARQIKALQSIDYKGFYCFEWEKVWHPEIEDPEIAIADYAHVVGQCLGNAQRCSE